MTSKSARGVTLLEMLVALVIFGIVAAVLYGTFTRTLESRDYAVSRADVFARARMAFDWLEQDLKGSLSVGTYPAGRPRFLSAGNGENETADLPLLDLTVRTTRRSAVIDADRDDAPGAVLVDQSRVVYRVEESEDGEDLAPPPRAGGGAIANGPRYLVRYELRPPLGDDDDLDSALRTVLVRGLARIEFRFVDRGAELERWEPEETTSLRSLGPRLVDIRLELFDADGRTTELSTTVLIPLGGRGG
jgi:prepilin-type N-terminal cleavage/methylation domain-containing protein